MSDAISSAVSSVKLGGTGIWSSGLRFGEPAEARDAATELEELGYGSLWVPDSGGDVFGPVENLLSATTSLVVATGVLNLWKQAAPDTAAAHARLRAAHGDRFLVGIGASHAQSVDVDGVARYARPYSAMVGYLDALDAANPPLAPGQRVLAALGPKMLELAGRRSAGAHPYNVTPEHTALARAAVGPDRLVIPEQAVALVGDAETGRRLGRDHLSRYLRLPNYVNNLRRLGFENDDFADGGSNRLVDAMVAWGDEQAISRRVHEHRAAGADHVCVQVVTEHGGVSLARQEWRDLAPALTAS